MVHGFPELLRRGGVHEVNVFFSNNTKMYLFEMYSNVLINMIVFLK